MKEILNIVFQGVFLLAGFGLGGWMLYYAFRSPGKGQPKDIDLDEPDIKHKFIGKV